MTSNIIGGEELERRFNRMAAQCSDAELSKWLRETGVDIAKEDLPRGWRQDLGGDAAMSNWPRRGDAMELTAYAKTVGPAAIEVRPSGRSTGPLSMLENGRTVRRAGQFRSRGTRTRKKDGSTYTRLVQVNRSVGPMAPKKTWSDGVEVAQREMPARLDVLMAKITLRKV